MNAESDPVNPTTMPYPINNTPPEDALQPEQGFVAEDPTLVPNFVPRIEEAKITLEFVQKLREAKLNTNLEPLDNTFLERIRNPPTTLPELGPDQWLSIDIYLSITNASEATYNDVRQAVLRRYPDSKILSHYQAKRLVTDLTGIISLMHDMCINSCMGYTGAYADLQACPFCAEHRYDRDKEKAPRKQFTTIPLATQLQALYRSKNSAKKMQYRQQYTDRLLDELEELEGSSGAKKTPYCDFFDGEDYLQAVHDGRISPETIVATSNDGSINLLVDRVLLSILMLFT